eukprot:Rmarinus@m.13129
MENKLHIKFWDPDETAKRCQGCESKFTVVKRRHHCRRCGGVFCDTCSSYKAILQNSGWTRMCSQFSCIPDLGNNKPQRICTCCHEEVSQEEKAPEVDRRKLSDFRTGMRGDAQRLLLSLETFNLDTVNEPAHASAPSSAVNSPRPTRSAREVLQLLSRCGSMASQGSDAAIRRVGIGVMSSVCLELVRNVLLGHHVKPEADSPSIRLCSSPEGFGTRSATCERLAALLQRLAEMCYGPKSAETETGVGVSKENMVSECQRAYLVVRTCVSAVRAASALVSTLDPAETLRTVLRDNEAGPLVRLVDHVETTVRFMNLPVDGLFSHVANDFAASRTVAKKEDAELLRLAQDAFESNADLTLNELSGRLCMQQTRVCALLDEHAALRKSMSTQPSLDFIRLVGILGIGKIFELCLRFGSFFSLLVERKHTVHDMLTFLADDKSPHRHYGGKAVIRPCACDTSIRQDGACQHPSGRLVDFDMHWHSLQDEETTVQDATSHAGDRANCATCEESRKLYIRSLEPATSTPAEKPRESQGEGTNGGSGVENHNCVGGAGGDENNKTDNQGENSGDVLIFRNRVDVVDYRTPDAGQCIGVTLNIRVLGFFCARAVQNFMVTLLSCVWRRSDEEIFEYAWKQFPSVMQTCNRLVDLSRTRIFTAPDGTPPITGWPAPLATTSNQAEPPTAAISRGERESSVSSNDSFQTAGSDASGHGANDPTGDSPSPPLRRVCVNAPVNYAALEKHYPGLAHTVGFLSQINITITDPENPTHVLAIIVFNVGRQAFEVHALVSAGCVVWAKVPSEKSIRAGSDLRHVPLLPLPPKDGTDSHQPLRKSTLTPQQLAHVCSEAATLAAAAGGTKAVGPCLESVEALRRCFRVFSYDFETCGPLRMTLDITASIFGIASLQLPVTHLGITFQPGQPDAAEDDVESNSHLLLTLEDIILSTILHFPGLRWAFSLDSLFAKLKETLRVRITIARGALQLRKSVSVPSLLLTHIFHRIFDRLVNSMAYVDLFRFASDLFRATFDDLANANCAPHTKCRPSS